MLSAPPIRTPFFDAKPDASSSPSVAWQRWFQAITNFLGLSGTYVPAVTSGSGVFTSATASGRYTKIGKLVFVEVTVAITTNGTAAGHVDVSLPFSSGSAMNVVAGRENGVSFKMLQGIVAGSGSAMMIVNYDNTYPGANGAQIVMSGIYEAAN